MCAWKIWAFSKVNSLWANFHALANLLGLALILYNRGCAAELLCVCMWLTPWQYGVNSSYANLCMSVLPSYIWVLFSQLLRAATTLNSTHNVATQFGLLLYNKRQLECRQTSLHLDRLLKKKFEHFSNLWILLYLFQNIAVSPVSTERETMLLYMFYFFYTFLLCGQAKGFYKRWK